MDSMKLPTVQLKDLVPTKEHSLLKHTLEFLENIWDEEYDILRQPSLGRETLHSSQNTIPNYEKT